MTRNTKLHKIATDKLTIIYRDLTVKEVGFLNGINNQTLKYEFAAKLSIIEPTDTKDIPIGLLIQVGQNTYKNSVNCSIDKDLFEIKTKEFRNLLESDMASPLPLISEIIKSVPGQSITDLLELTYEDLLELVCLCEKIREKQILNISTGVKKKGMKLVNTKDLPDDGKSLKEKMAELNSALGTK